MPKCLRLLALAVLFGCPVQEPTPPRLDLGIQQVDGSISCVGQPSLCERGERCDQDRGLCVPNTTCTGHADCLVDLRCVDGSCAMPEGACVEDRDCAEDERCAPSKVCIRDIDPLGSLQPVCSERSTCRLGTSCVLGVCESCGDQRPCPGAQLCRQGICEEPSTCRTSTDCFSGHSCNAGTCTRPVGGCAPDPSNDLVSGATLLREAHVDGFDLCGFDRDWYALRLEPYVGARIIITPETPATGAFVALQTRVMGDRGESIEGVSTLHWPGRSIIEVPGRDSARELRLEVSGNQNARYAIDTERVMSLCAGDMLDLLGDETEASAPRASLSKVRGLQLRACPGDRDHLRLEVSRNELLSLGFELEAEEGARLGLTAQAGASGPIHRASFTATVTEPLTLPRLTEDAELRLAVSGDRTPELGATYRWLPDLETAARFQACQAPTPAISQPALDLGADVILGDSACKASAAFEAETIFVVSPVSVPTLLRATVRTVSSTTAELGLRLLDSCSRDSSTRTCDASPRSGLGASIEHVITSTTPVYLVVSTNEPSSLVTFEIGFDEDDNFTCIGGRSDRLDQSGTRPVSTVEATRSFELSAGSMCGPAGVGSGPDRFFELDVSARQTVVLELSGRPDGFLWVGTTCARLSETCTAAASINDIASPARVVLEPAIATRYVVVVDGYGPTDAGDYELRALFSPQCLSDSACAGGQRCDDYVCAGPPANDQCPGTALTLSSGRATANGSTGAAGDDFDSTTCLGGIGGSDVVYALELAAPAARLEARITRATFDPLLYVRRNLCESPAAELVCNDDQDLAAGNLLPAVVLSNVPAGTYYLVVDAYSFGGVERGGTFELELSVTP